MEEDNVDLTTRHEVTHEVTTDSQATIISDSLWPSNRHSTQTPVESSEQ